MNAVPPMEGLRGLRGQVSPGPWKDRRERRGESGTPQPYLREE